MLGSSKITVENNKMSPTIEELPSKTGKISFNSGIESHHVRNTNIQLNLENQEEYNNNKNNNNSITTDTSSNNSDDIEIIVIPTNTNEKEDCLRRKHQLLSGGAILMDQQTDKSYLDIKNIEFEEFETHVWLLLWLALGPSRLQHLTSMVKENDNLDIKWDKDGGRLIWKALQLCCLQKGSKSPSAVPLPENHKCNIICLRDHASRMLEICAPTRELWRNFGWAGLTVDAVLSKILRDDILPHVLPRIPKEVNAALERIEYCRTILKPFRRFPSHELQAAINQSAINYANERRRRGRPSKSPNSCVREPGRLERVYLWRFLLELLDEIKPCNGCVRWISREEGIFRIHNSDLLARLWGRRHGNPRMTYEKMARAMRTYYRSKILLPVPRTRNLPRKLVYRFSQHVLLRYQHCQNSSPRQIITTAMLQDTQ